MKELRLHGIGGQGTVKAGEMLVVATVLDGNSGNSIPFFGFERQGAPVTSFVRLDKVNIRPKNQVYEPNCVLVMDSTVMASRNVFEGIQEDTYLVINTKAESPDELDLPENVKHVAMIDATKIALDIIKRPLPNTVMLAAFSKLTNWVSEGSLRQVVAEQFGKSNEAAFNAGYSQAKIYHLESKANEI